MLVNGESDPEMYKDSQGDIWDSKTIGQVFTTEANQTNHDLYHNKNKIEGIQTIANYRNKTVENIGGRDVPIGSWRKDIMVTDDEVIELIKSNQINGVSPNNALQQCPICVNELKNIKGNIYYNKDIENKECMNPIFTSLVPEPANGYGMNVHTYDKFLEKSKNPKGDKLSKEFKDMLKAFGESVVNYAEGIDNEEVEETELEEQQVETQEAVEEDIEETEEETKDISLEQEVAELKKSVEKQSQKINELIKSGDIVKEEDSIDDVKADVRNAIIDKDFGDVEYPDVWDVLFADDCMIVKDYDNNNYLKYDYTVADDGTVSIGDSSEVELQYAPKDSPETDTVDDTTDTSAVESQKSRTPRIKPVKEKLENVEMEKQKDKKLNHLDMPIMSTKELAKPRNQFHF